MKPKRYAEGTTVAPEKSEMEIKSLLRKRGASEIWSGTGDDTALVGFTMKGKRVRFSFRLPKLRDVRAVEAETRRLWRALLLSIKARLEVVDSGIESFESSFFAHIVTADDRTVFEAASPALEVMYATGLMPTSFLALPAPTAKETG